MSKRDYYEVLGVPKNASDDEIKKAYRKLAAAHHPDRHADADKPKHEALFKEAKEAYETLSDPQKRAVYDTDGFQEASFAPPRHGNFRTFMNGEEVDLSIIQAQMRAYMRQQQEQAVQMVRIRLPIKEAFEGRAVPLNVYGQNVVYPVRAGLPPGAAFVDEVMIGEKQRRLHVQLFIDSTPFSFVMQGSEDGIHFSGDLETEVEVEALSIYLGGWIKIKDFLGTELQVRIPANFDPKHRLKVAQKGYSNWNGDKPGERGDLYLRVKPVFSLDRLGIEKQLKSL